MSDDNIRLYRRDATAPNPFGKTTGLTDTGVSGSKWGLPQIEWLGVKIEWSCAINQLLGSESGFQLGSQLQTSISDAMDRPWSHIINDEHIERNTFYGELANLAYITTPLGDYEKSSTIEDPSSPRLSPDRHNLSLFSTPPPKQGGSSPGKHFPSSPLPMPGPLTPSPKGKSLSNFQHQEPQPPWSSPLSSPPAIIKTPPQYPQHGSKRWPALSSPTSRGNTSSGIEGVYPSSTQVALERPSSKAPKISQEQLQAEDKDEKDVESAAQAFLSLLSECFHDRCKDNPPDPRRQWNLDLRYL